MNFTEEDMGEDVKNIATSIKIEKGHTVPRPLLLSQILHSFSSYILDLKKMDGKEKLLSSYRKECDTIGREISVMQDEEKFTGTALGITEQGALIVRVGEKEKIFAAADVHHLRMK